MDVATEIAGAEGPLVLYDGQCGLCNRVVQFVVKHDRRGRFRFAALQSDTGRALLERHGLPVGALDTFVLVDGDHAFTKSRAALRAAGWLDAPWPLVRVFAAVPRPLADVVYDFVARNRYRWFGRTDACMLPPPEVRARFLG